MKSDVLKFEPDAGSTGNYGSKDAASHVAEGEPVARNHIDDMVHRNGATASGHELIKSYLQSCATNTRRHGRRPP